MISNIVYSFFAINFVVQKLDLKCSKFEIFICLAINSIAVVLMNYLVLDYYIIQLALLVTYFLEFLYLSKLQWRITFFAASNVALNVLAVNLLVVLGEMAVSDLTINQIKNNTDSFSRVMIITNVSLSIALYIIGKFISNKKMKEIATAKFYSEIMSAVLVLMVLFLAHDVMFIGDINLSFEFLISTTSTAVFVLILYYCLLIFNISLINLHPYKRKADEARFVHERVIEKKIATEFKVYSDDLTKLYNRRFVFSKLDELCNDSQSKFGLVFLDLASLKYVNDNFGHKTGDEYIIDIANILKKCVREEDLSARIGGDEFLLVLFDITSEDLEIVINRIKKSVSKFNKTKPFTFHANIGYMCFDMADKPHTRTEMLNYVDELMNIDKERFYKKGGVV